MIDLEVLLGERLAAAFAAVGGVAVDPVVRRSQHADFQSDAALGLARRLGRPPREVATEVLRLADVEGAEVSGPGFINLTVPDATLSQLVATMAADERLGVPVSAAPETVVVDYSGPNV